MSKKIQTVLKTKQALQNPVLPVRYISPLCDISPPVIYRMMRGERYADIGPPPEQLPDRQTGGEPLRKFLSYLDLMPDDIESRGKYDRLSTQIIKNARVISHGLPFVRLVKVCGVYNISENALHRVTSGDAYPHIKGSYNKIMKLKRMSFLDGKPFTTNSGYKTETANAMHG